MLTPIFITIGSLVLSNTLHNLFTFMGPPRVDLWAYQNKTTPKTRPTIQTMLTPIFIKIGSLVFANTLQNLCRKRIHFWTEEAFTSDPGVEPVGQSKNDTLETHTKIKN